MPHIFNNRFLAALPSDESLHPEPRQTPGVAHSFVTPTGVSQPSLLAWSDEMAEVLGISRPTQEDDSWLQTLAGNSLQPGMQPYANCYGGHQFGQWAGQLGDGRAISLGELVNDAGESWELQLKGAGITPYSRGADGRAVLRSSLREFICSEAMQHLGVPTTRALSLVTTGDDVVRDMFYDGRPQAEQGAIVCRAAPSFIRFGSFELPASRGETGLLKQLADFTISSHFPEFDLADPMVYSQWFAEVCRRTAHMIVEWQSVGFVHGVMNTDNMSVHGLTIDYGPYGWLEPYEPNWTPNTSDQQHRYSFAQQPQIAQWNLAKFGSALIQLVGEPEPLQAALEAYADSFNHGYANKFATKLGFDQANDDLASRWLEPLYALMAKAETDYCLLFRALSNLPIESPATDGGSLLDTLAPAFYDFESLRNSELESKWLKWLADYQAYSQQQASRGKSRSERMNAVNPKFVPRNYLAQQAIEAAERGDVGPLEKLQTVLRRPYDEQPENEIFAARRPDWARQKAGCSALSCSS